MSDAVPL